MIKLIMLLILLCQIVADATSNGIKNAFYACFFGEDALYLYNVGLIKNHSDKEKKWCPKTTAS